jgi:hypothetical protein
VKKQWKKRLNMSKNKQNENKGTSDASQNWILPNLIRKCSKIISWGATPNQNDT